MLNLTRVKVLEKLFSLTYAVLCCFVFKQAMLLGLVKTYFISNSTVFDKSYYLLLTLVVLYSVVHFII